MTYYRTSQYKDKPLERVGGHLESNDAITDY